MSSSGNVLKYSFTTMQDTEKRVIDANELMAKRMEELAQKAAQQEYTDFAGDDPGMESAGGFGDGFTAGLSAEQVEGLLGDLDAGDGLSGNVIKADGGAADFTPFDSEAGDHDAAREQLLAETKGAADAFLADAQEKARQEADHLLQAAREQIAAEREETLQQAKDQGYREGFQKAEQEFAKRSRDLEEKEKALEAEYDAILKDLEPRMVDVISDAYEYLIGEELSGYRDVLLYMISQAVRKTEGGKSFLVHISGEDYPYVSMEKKQLEGALPSPSATLELVEDTTLSHNECMIETEGGIFDCGLGTQMAELKKRLRLLAYERGE